MKKIIILGLIVISLLLVSGCAPSCPRSCNDYNKCTEDICSSETNFTCVHKPIKPCSGNDICEKGEYGGPNLHPDCPDCNDNIKFTEDRYNYLTKKCENTKLTNKEIVQKCVEDWSSIGTLDDDGGSTSEIFITTCIRLAAIDLEDISLCQEILDSTYKNSCISYIAYQTNNLKLCYNIDGKYKVNSCIYNFAVDSLNYSVCEKINDEVTMSLCFQSVYGHSNKYTTTKCEGVSSKYKDLCLTSLNKKTR